MTPYTRSCVYGKSMISLLLCLITTVSSYRLVLHDTREMCTFVWGRVECSRSSATEEHDKRLFSSIMLQQQSSEQHTEAIIALYWPFSFFFFCSKSWHHNCSTQLLPSHCSAQPVIKTPKQPTVPQEYVSFQWALMRIQTHKLVPAKNKGGIWNWHCNAHWL